MPRIGKFRKAEADRKRYVVDYEDWMNEDELVTTVAASGDVPADNFYVDGYIVDTDGKEVIFYVSGGVEGSSYDVTITINTTLQQIKEDFVTFVVT